MTGPNPTDDYDDACHITLNGFHGSAAHVVSAASSFTASRVMGRNGTNRKPVAHGHQRHVQSVDVQSVAVVADTGELTPRSAKGFDNHFDLFPGRICPDNASEMSPRLRCSFAQGLYPMRTAAAEGPRKWEW